MSEKKRIVQVKNPKTGKYVKIDREKGRIVAHKKSEGPFKGVAVARKRS
jgi:hypothetical protein